MSNTKREPDFVERIISEYAGRRGEVIRKMYGSTIDTVKYDHGQTTLCVLEAKISKDAELIQQLVDLIFHDTSCSSASGRPCDCMASVAFARAAAQGFTPTPEQ